MCDLKHYKTGQFALRWRTEDEVLSGAGQETCGNTRCEHHAARSPPALKTLELPFNYVEHGERQSALVKVVLCDRCVRKLMWKRNHDKEARLQLKRESAEDKLALQLAAPAVDSTARAKARETRDRRSASPARHREDDDRSRRRRRLSRSPSSTLR